MKGMGNLRLVLSNKLILASLIICILNSPLIWFSGIFVGEEEYILGACLFIASLILNLIDIIIYWILFFSPRGE